ncbi:MAG: Gfo/Idh/MocA family oxidoreductase [Pirellulaceae bacterium]|nr:Gfo/Idh/MocA family oxidoreductase [Pirellulaceae bacterium]
MPTTNRRTFMQAAGAGALALAAARQNPAAAAQNPEASRQNLGADADDTLTLGVIGPGGMGSNHLRLLAARRDVRVAYVCDVDRQRLDKAAELAEQTSGRKPQAVTDMRKVLDDKAVDAVFIATPDHWHAPAAILALDAGKHVYVEKPCCHNIREGRLMREAVQRSGKLLQVGTQSRSTDCVREGIQRVLAGEIGEVLVAKAWNSQRRGSIGKSQPTQPPDHLDYDAWLGPAPLVPYRSNMLPGVWRWWYDFGCGDIGNDGVHDIDVAVWGLGVDQHPTTATCLGGKSFFDDDQQFPDTQYAVFEYPAEGAPAGRRKQLIFEQRIWSPYVQEGYENGAAFYGTEGLLVMGHTQGWRLYGPRNKLLAERTGGVDLVAHHQNFFDCIRGKQDQLNADVHAGTLSATLVHLANISARVQRTLRFDPQLEQILADDEANALVGRNYREGGHWSVPRVG